MELGLYINIEHYIDRLQLVQLATWYIGVKLIDALEPIILELNLWCHEVNEFASGSQQAIYSLLIKQ